MAVLIEGRLGIHRCLHLHLLLTYTFCSPSPVAHLHLLLTFTYNLGAHHDDNASTATALHVA